MKKSLIVLLCFIATAAFAQQGAKVVLVPHRDPGFKERLEMIKVTEDYVIGKEKKYDSTYATANVKWIKETASKCYVEWTFDKYARDTAKMDNKDKAAVYILSRFTELSPIVITIRKLDGVVAIDNQSDIDSVSKKVAEEVARLYPNDKEGASKEIKGDLMEFLVAAQIQKELIKPIEVFYGMYNTEDTIAVGVKQDIKTLGKNNRALGDLGAFSPKGYRLLEKTNSGDYKLTMDLDIDMSEMMAMFAGMAKSLGGDVKADTLAKTEMQFKGMYIVEFDKQTNITSSYFKLDMKGNMMGEKGDKKEWVRIRKIG
jgi:hypothetical protein